MIEDANVTADTFQLLIDAGFPQSQDPPTIMMVLRWLLWNYGVSIDMSAKRDKSKWRYNIYYHEGSDLMLYESSEYIFDTDTNAINAAIQTVCKNIEK